MVRQPNFSNVLIHASVGQGILQILNSSNSLVVFGYWLWGRSVSTKSHWVQAAKASLVVGHKTCVPMQPSSDVHLTSLGREMLCLLGLLDIMF